MKRTEDGLPQTYYLRSSVLGGQVVAEIVWASVSWQWNRGYVYLGSQLLAVQQGGVNWMHEDPVTKSKRVTNSSGAIVSTIELDPWGAEIANRSSNAAFQPKKFTSYERDASGADEAMFRRYNRWHSRFDQPDPWDGSYDFTNPQSFNRYAYVQGDPVNLVDPSGLMTCEPGYYGPECDSSSLGRWGGGFDMNERHSNLNPTGREIIMGNFGLDVRYIARFRSLQWTDDEGEEHVTFWWERMPQGYTHFGGNSFILVRSGGRHEEPRVFAQKVPRLIAEGQAWDKWYAWVNCNTPIMDMYNSQLDNFHKIGGEAFWAEVGVGIAAGTVVASGGLKTTIPDEGVPVGVWGVVLMGAATHYWERERINNIMNAYAAEVSANCGAKPSHP